MKTIFTLVLFLWSTVCHTQKKDDLKSLHYTKRAILIAEKINHSEKNEVSNLLISNGLYDLDAFTKNLANVEDYLKNLEKEKESLLYYQKKSEILQKASIKYFQASADSILKKRKDEDSFFRKKSNLVILILSSLIIIVYARLKRKNIIKKRALQEAQKELDHKKKLISLWEDEKKNLENRINGAFEEVIHLARNHDPTFLARFKEVYPEFCRNLLEKYPDMLNSELTFCAYLKLNLSSKEIANYTFVTNKAIELRKNRFRKKMGIPSEENLYIWIGNI